MPTDDPNGMTYRITQVKLAIWATTQNFHVGKPSRLDFSDLPSRKSLGPLHPSRLTDHAAIESLVSTLDGALVVLDPIWAAFLSKRVPIGKLLFYSWVGAVWEIFDSDFKNRRGFIFKT